MFAILIQPATEQLIAAMNNGVAPEMEHEATYFVYHDETAPPEIISGDNLVRRRRAEDGWTPLEFVIWQK